MTPERLAKGDILCVPDAHGRIRQAQSVSNTILDYLLYTEALNEEHKFAADFYQSWKQAYDCRAGYRGNNSESVRGLTHVDSYAADRYVKCILLMPKAKTALVNTACYLPALTTARWHAREFHLSYSAAFDKLIEIIDIVRVMELK